jgi:hypothetical protein
MTYLRFRYLITLGSQSPLGRNPMRGRAEGLKEFCAPAKIGAGIANGSPIASGIDATKLKIGHGRPLSR